MSSNVGLTTPRGSGTSGYVQRNSAFIKPRAAGYGAPYPSPSSGGFKQRLPDKQILEHDRLRAIEVQVMEERERLEEENERIEEEMSKKKKKTDKEEGEQDEERVLTEEEIDARCEVLRQRLLKEGESGNGNGQVKGKALKRYQVHELAEAKIEESERLRRALGLKEDRDTGEISSKKWERRRD
ncbi:uncharacterized protein N7477_004675 [Penicillium maclennaniae]|uniref:uncharacterized protein n=1 Tax=Penicillium maclennaniae TaxID=1343394 RepID=UPI00254015B8|nr:uncharacterized protein N7477_004675 [Penicillium maclennaniae]KAJ5674741.1 hypothetical protein N7477_004675 [Penicillium maclennaniae]